MKPILGGMSGCRATGDSNNKLVVVVHQTAVARLFPGYISARK
jgi:hypothetical protein